MQYIENIYPFESLLKQADQYYSSGYFELYKQRCEKAFTLAQNAGDFLKVLKRMYKLVLYVNNGENYEDWEWLFGYAYNAWEKMPGNDKLQYFAAYSALYSGRIDLCLEILKNRPDKEEYHKLYIQAALLSEKYELIDEGLTETFKPLLIVNSTNPVEFEKIGILYEDERFFIDAALLFLKEGKIEEAQRIAQNYFNSDNTIILSGLIAYDAGDINMALDKLTTACDIFEDRDDILLLTGDLLLLKGKLGNAENYYRQVIEADMPLSNLACLNLSWIYLQENRIKEALSLLEQAFENYPDNDNVVIELVKALLESGNRQRALNVLEKYIEGKPDRIKARLLLLVLERESLTAETYQAHLWALFESYPSNSIICGYLCWYFISINHIDDAELALDIYKKAGGEVDTPWYYHYSGLLYALRGSYSKAIDSLDYSLKVYDDPSIRYNKAIVLLLSGDTNLAKQELDKALLSGVFLNDSNNELLIRIHTKLGEIYFLDGDMEKAYQEVQYVLEIEPQNYEALILLNKLEKGM